MAEIGRKFKAEGDSWSVRLSEQATPPEVQVVLFFCLSTDQRPYRVVEVAREELPDVAALKRMSEQELQKLFQASNSMGFPRTFHSSSLSDR